MTESDAIKSLHSSINEDLESCLPTLDAAHFIGNNNENEICHNVRAETVKELGGDEISEGSKTSYDSEINDDIDSSSSNSSTVNNAHSNCDQFSETSSQDLPDSGAEMETDIKTKFKGCTVPNLSAEDELLMEINMQLPGPEDFLKSQSPNVYQHPFSITQLIKL